MTETIADKEKEIRLKKKELKKMKKELKGMKKELRERKKAELEDLLSDYINHPKVREMRSWQSEPFCMIFTSTTGMMMTEDRTDCTALRIPSRPDKMLWKYSISMRRNRKSYGHICGRLH